MMAYKRSESASDNFGKSTNSNLKPDTYKETWKDPNQII